jgi:hypothetical protein
MQRAPFLLRKARRADPAMNETGMVAVGFVFVGREEVRIQKSEEENYVTGLNENS